MMRKILRGLCAVAFVCILLIPGGGDKAWGAFVNIRQARNVATSWILKDSNPMKNGMGHKVREVLVYSGGIHGNPGYYVALMEPAGWMIIPADDAFEPILAFGNDLMTREAYEQSPLFRLVRVDAPRLHQRATATSRPIGGEDIPEAKRLEREDRWNYLARTAISGGRLVFLLREGGVRQDHYQKDSFADTVIPPLLDGL